MKTSLKSPILGLVVFAFLVVAVRGDVDGFYAGRLTGDVIGTPGSWKDNTLTTKAAVFDGNTDTFFDAPRHDGAWVGLDLGDGKSVCITKIGFCPRKDDDARSQFSLRMVGGKFQGANTDDFKDAVDLFTIAKPPEQESMTYHLITLKAAFRYVRFLSPVGGNGNLAELEFYGEPPHEKSRPSGPPSR